MTSKAGSLANTPTNMNKNRFLSLLAIGLLADNVAWAQNTATTTPVGYVTATIGGNTSGNTEGAATFVSASLHNPVVYAAAATASPSGGSVVNLPTGVPANLDGSYLLEITNGSQEGWWTTIVSSDSTSITVADEFPASLASDVAVSVRKFTTLQDIFGENTPGLTPFSNENPYDEIQVLDPVNQAVSQIIRVGGDWMNAVTEEVVDDLIVYPGTAVKVIRKGATPLQLVVSGSVKVTKTQVDVYANDNWIGQITPVLSTFSNLNFGSQLAATDLVNVIRPDNGNAQIVEEFIAFNGSMYNSVTEELADSELIADGGGIIIRRSTGQAGPIIIPAPAIGQ